jgi:penicillin amidase
MIVIIVFLVTSIYLFQSLSGKSEYREQGTIYIEGIGDTVEIFRDDFGVPHIEARNEADMYFMMGYTHAQDRLWQMDLSRRVANGSLSEILGKDALEYDKLFRTVGIGKTAKKIYEQLPDKTKEILKYYSAGVNLFLIANRKKLPLEFDVLDYKPEEWKPEDCVSIVRLMGWELNISWFAEFNFINIINKFGTEKAREFIPDNHPEAPYTIKNNEIRIKNTDTEKKELGNNEHPFNQLPNHPITQSSNHSIIQSSNHSIIQSSNPPIFLIENFVKTAMEFREKFGLKGMRVGSNAWVISGEKTESKKPILANDPHIPLMAPSRWYEVVMTDKSRKAYISGFSVPGVPGVLIGSNNAISWGITSLMNDETDYYILSSDSVSGVKIDSTIEDIKVKGQKEEFSHIVHTTKYGPVISDLQVTGFGIKQKANTPQGKIAVFRWTGFEYSNEIGAIYEINNAGNWNDFKNGLRSLGVPALNFVYADTSGNIGYKAAGKVPIRKYSEESEIFTGISPNDENMSWSGFVSFEELPQTYNPSSGYIVTANNKPQSDYRYFISYLYEPHYRAARIEELLKERNNFSADEIKLVQTDVSNLMAKEFCNYLFRAVNVLEMDTAGKISHSVSLTESEKNYLMELKKWDFNFKSASTGATLFAQFETELYKNLYRKKLGEEMFLNYLTLGSVPVKNTSKLMRNHFLNVVIEEYRESSGKGTIGISDEFNFENLRDALLKSFKDAIKELTNIYNSPDITKWKWGELHKVKFSHLLGIVPAMSPILDSGPYEADGAGETIFNLEYSYVDAVEKNNYSSALGSSLRFIIDMKDSRTYLSILPPGQNGQNISEHYRDQARLWLNGEYKRVQAVIGRLSIYGMKKAVYVSF